MQKHILAIDDEEDIRSLLEEVFTLNGYRVSAVGSPEEARRVARTDPPQLIISDLQLTDSDGMALSDELKTIVPNVPVLLLTGVVFDEDVIRDNIQKRFASYLDKTAPLERIVSEVRHLLGDARPN